MHIGMDRYIPYIHTILYLLPSPASYYLEKSHWLNF